jgi:deoxyribose-phosphate aldolase
MNYYNPQASRVAAAIDHTLLKPTMLAEDVKRLCGEAVDYGFAAVCVPPPFVNLAKETLQGTKVQVATVVGFPFGYSATEAKLAEILLAMVDGADELDVVINFTAVKNNDWAYVANEINHLLPVIHAKGKKIKTIIESGVLNDEEIVRCCKIYGAAGVDYVKTSTGFAEKSATVEAVALMRSHLPVHINIKASGGIKTLAFATQLLDAGATRLGCSSSIAIVSQQEASGNY